MTATALAPSPVTRRIRWLAFGIVLVLAAYTAVWFVAASQIETRLSAFLAERKTDGVSGECDAMDVRGFPFRIGLFCDAIRIDDTRHAASGTFGALRSAAQVYRPGHAVVELDGPAEVRISPGLSLSSDWSLLHGSLQASLSGVSRTSIAANQLAGTALLPASGESFGIRVVRGEVHLRQNGEDLDAAANLEKLDIRPGDGESLLPPLDANFDVRIADRAQLMDAGGFVANPLRDSGGDVRNLTLDLGNGMIGTVTGPFTIDADGLISGEFTVAMKNIEGWRQALTKAFPDEDGTALVNNIANMLTALADGGNDSTVKLNVRDGTAFLAFIPIGVLPRL